MKSFVGKVAAITGAGSGIGRQLALALAAKGCHLALGDIDELGLAETAEPCRAHGVRVTTTRLDVSRRDAVHAWSDQVVREHERVHLVFNNAGVALGGTLEGVSYEDFQWIMDINFWGVVYGTRAFLPHLRASGDGHIVNISSIFGMIGVPGNGTYCATKFAVRGFTETLRQELELTKAPVSATCVHPGGIKTNIARHARISDQGNDILGDPEVAREQFERMFITSAAKAAQVILHAVRRNRRRVLVGPDAVALDLLVRLLPSAYQSVTKSFTRRQLATSARLREARP